MQDPRYHFPTLAELNAEIDISNEKPVEDKSQVLKKSNQNNFAWIDHPHETNIQVINLHGTTKILSKLMANIIKSDDKMFFIMNEIEDRQE